MGLKLNTASGGSITLQEANTASNLTLTVPAQDGSLVTANSSGNVGIGTSSPLSLLQLGNTSNANQSLSFSFPDSATALINSTRLTGGTIQSLRISAGDTIQAYTTGLERMRIDSSGNLLVNTTSTTPASSNVNGSALLQFGGASFSRTNSITIDTNRDGSNGTIINFRRTGTTVGSISVTTTATTYATSSDYRLKENITPMTGALARVAALKPVTYSWKSDGSTGEGFIAHELSEVVPDCVSGEKDAVDSEGKPIYQGIDTSFLVATLTAAIQEQQAIITELKARIEVLENK
jgi:hypothetical protein